MERSGRCFCLCGFLLSTPQPSPIAEELLQWPDRQDAGGCVPPRCSWRLGKVKEMQLKDQAGKGFSRLFKDFQGFSRVFKGFALFLLPFKAF